jgi:hypothetical protein
VPQATLTIVTELVRQGDAELVQHLSAKLDELGNQRGPSAVPFSRVDGLHFARFAIVQDPDAKKSSAAQPGAALPTLLVFSLVFDESSDGDDCLERLVAVARSNLDDVYAACAGYPGAGASASDVKVYLLAKNVEPLLFYQGAGGVTVRAVRESGDLRKRLEDELDRRMRVGAIAETPVSMARALRATVSLGDPGAVSAPLDRLSSVARNWRTFAWIVEVFVAPAAVLLGVPFGVAWRFGATPWHAVIVAFVPALALALAVFLHERADAARLVREPDVATADHLEQVRDEEDHAVQNALTHLAIVKTGWLRYWLVKYVFWVIGRRVVLIDRFEGSLGGIASIHFARWVQLDREQGSKRRRLLFLSDYDGSWESYLGEFVDRAATGLTAVWSNTENFPKTSWVFGEGARDEQRFKDWTRNRQLKTPVWYTAYPDRTLDNVENDTQIAHLVASAKTAEEDTAWLALL